MSLIKIMLLFLVTTIGFASDNIHLYPVKEENQSKTQNVDNLKYPGFCEIEIINDSYIDVIVRGIYDDGVMMRPFSIYSYEYPHYISLYYNWYCHRGMSVFIDSFDGYRLYENYVTRGSTIHIVPYFGSKKPKVEIKSRAVTSNK